MKSDPCCDHILTGGEPPFAPSEPEIDHVPQKSRQSENEHHRVLAFGLLEQDVAQSDLALQELERMLLLVLVEIQLQNRFRGCPVTDVLGPLPAFQAGKIRDEQLRGREIREIRELIKLLFIQHRLAENLPSADGLRVFALARTPDCLSLENDILRERAPDEGVRVLGKVLLDLAHVRIGILLGIESHLPERIGLLLRFGENLPRDRCSPFGEHPLGTERHDPRPPLRCSGAVFQAFPVDHHIDVEEAVSGFDRRSGPSFDGNHAGYALLETRGEVRRTFGDETEVRLHHLRYELGVGTLAVYDDCAFLWFHHSEKEVDGIGIHGRIRCVPIIWRQIAYHPVLIGDGIGRVESEVRAPLLVETEFRSRCVRIALVRFDDIGPDLGLIDMEYPGDQAHVDLEPLGYLPHHSIAIRFE